MKKLALLMCAVMLLGSLFACIPASAATNAKTAGGPLAITEICPAPDDSKYEYIEIVNVSGSNVNIKDYYIYRAGFSNGGNGNWHAEGTQYMIGTKVQGVSVANTDKSFNVRVSCENATGDTTLAPNVVTLVWFVSGNAKDETIDDFKLYWRGAGHDLTNVKVVRVQVCNDSGINLAPGTILKGGYTDDSNTTFLPEREVGFMIMLIHKDVAAEDILADGETNILKFVKKDGDNVGSMHWRSKRADSAAIMLINGKCDTTSAHYYNIVDPEKYRTAVANFIFPSDVTNEMFIIPADLPLGMMTPERTNSNEESFTSVANLGRKGDGLAFFDYAPKYLATPGTLYKGQLGNTDGETPALYAANGEGTLVGGVGSSIKNLAIIEGDNSNANKDDAATDDTTAPADTTPAEEEGGCGSVVATSAFAVLAPVMVVGCGVTFKRRRRK